MTTPTPAEMTFEQHLRRLQDVEATNAAIAQAHTLAGQLNFGELEPGSELRGALSNWILHYRMGKAHSRYGAPYDAGCAKCARTSWRLVDAFEEGTQS